MFDKIYTLSRVSERSGLETSQQPVYKKTQGANTAKAIKL